MKTQFRACVLLLTLASLAGCGDSSAKKELAGRPQGPTAEGRRYLLPQEPATPMGVMDARETAEHDAPVAVVGCVGGGLKPWVEGRSAFLLVDATAAIACDEGCAEDCNCHVEELAGSTTMVKIVGDNGQLLGVDSRELLGIRESDTVVVSGSAKRDGDGNLTIIANGVFIRR